MVLNFIAILLSLAMTLTGVGGEGQPAAASRNLVLHNISVSYNGEALRLGHKASLGVSTDGEKAVFDFGVDLDGERLLPVQLGVTREGVTALLGGSDVAVTVTARAIDAFAEQLGEQLEGAMGDAENPEVLNFITDEFMPAYTAMLGAAMDDEARQRINAACQAVFEETVDRGEGTPGTAMVEDEEYPVTIYDYTLDSAKLAELADTLYAADPVLEDYYDALFRLYDMLPEESGLKGISSFADMFEKMALDMTMDINEQLSDDGQVDIIDAVLTMDMNGMVQAMAQMEPAVEAIEEEIEEEAAEIVPEEAPEDEVGAAAEAEPEADVPNEIEPLVMNINSVKLGDMNDVRMSCAYDVDESHGFEMEAWSTGESDTQEMEMTMTILENGEKVDRCKLSAFIASDEESGSSYSLSVRNIQQDVARFDVGFYGLTTAEGTSENTFTFAFRNEDAIVDVSFDLDVTADEIEDAVNGREDAYVIDDLSEAGIQALGEDQDFAALMMKAAASLTSDAGKLTRDRDLQNLMTLMKGERLPIDVDDIDREDAAATYDLGGEDLSFVIDGDDGQDVEYELEDVEDVEDDGVLGYGEPSFTWLPDGWKVASSASDTAYDWVEMSITDEAGADCAYAIFFPDNEEETIDYIVQENGGILEGRKISVANYGEGSLSVSLRESGLYCEMMFASDIDEETLGKIIAGIRFDGE